MSKAEDKAKEFLKNLVPHTTLYKGTIDELEVYEPDDVILAYKEGCHQAEKDLELTWEDIKEICVQSVLVEVDLGGLVSDERHYTEVLKRFKERKKN